MKILVIGNGGREHAISHALKSDDREIFAARGNAGTESFCKNVDIDPEDLNSLLEFALEEKIDLTIVGPENPLCLGIVDLFRKNNLKIFGVDKRAAQFEKSKDFTKEFLIRNDIPTARSITCKNYDEAIDSISNFSYPLVIKADGLCLGKGVIIAEDREIAVKTLEDIFIKKIFGDGGKKVLIEEFLDGWETSLICFVSDNKICPMEFAFDHKKIGEGETGKNTGGVGAYSKKMNFSKELEENFEKVLKSIEEGFNKENFNYNGILFIGFMVESNTPKVLEFNVRFGDPETEVLLPRLKSDLLELIEKCLDKNLERADIKFTDEASLGVVICSGGYPESYEKNLEIKGLEEVDILSYHNGTKRDGQKILTNGGRVLTLVALSEDLKSAAKKVYEEIEKIDFKDMYYRRDIGNREDISC